MCTYSDVCKFVCLYVQTLVCVCMLLYIHYVYMYMYVYIYIYIYTLFKYFIRLHYIMYVCFICTKICSGPNLLSTSLAPSINVCLIHSYGYMKPNGQCK